MSWQLGAFGLLAAALAAGFAWYERTRPDTKVVALVGTLAALAAVGRIAFAALPNVKPTTDIVLISGYALGGGPGFVVGAVAGLASNFFFGQGPWTPWQMAAWGATGVLGAGLAAVTRGRLPRWPLALCCAAAGYAFAAIQDVGDWVNYSDHSVAQLGVYVAKGTGFDFVHAGGCLAFALLFGPALSGSLQRFATRLQVTWRPVPEHVVVPAAALGVLLAGAGFLAAPTPAQAATPQSYLLAAQNPDGGYGAAPGEPSSQMYAAWAALGLASERYNPLDIRHGGRSLLSYVTDGAGPGSDPGTLERTILVLGVTGHGGGRDLIGALTRRFGGDGSISQQVNLTAFGILALRAVAAPLPSRALPWLARQQNSDGGFSFATAGAPSDVDDTAAVLEAVTRAGGPSSAGARAQARAVAYLRRQQNRDGGFPAQDGGDSNAQSTAWAVQGLVAAGAAPGSVHRAGGRSPLQYLNSLIASDGHVRYSRGSDQTPVWVTAEAAMALAQKSLPLTLLAALAPRPAAAGSPGSRSAAGGAGASGAPARAAGGTRTPGPGRSRQGAHASPRRPPAGRPRPESSPSAVLGELAGAAGLVTAILLAPVGLA